jgi:hypothetical protein
MNLPSLSTYLLIPLLSYGILFLKKLDQAWVEILGGQGFIKKVSYYIDRGDSFNYLNLKLYLSLFIIIIIVVLVVLCLNSLYRA